MRPWPPGVRSPHPASASGPSLPASICPPLESAVRRVFAGACRSPCRTSERHCRPAIGSLGRSGHRSPSSSETRNTPGQGLHPTASDRSARFAGPGRTLPHKPIRDPIRSPQSARVCLCADRLPEGLSSSQTGQVPRVVSVLGERLCSGRRRDHRVPPCLQYSTRPPATVFTIAYGSLCNGNDLIETANRKSHCAGLDPGSTPGGASGPSQPGRTFTEHNQPR